jgi:hypothetical protein
MRHSARTVAAIATSLLLLAACGGADDAASRDDHDRQDAERETVLDDMIERKDSVGPRVEAAQDAHRQQLEDQLSRDEGAAPPADRDP